MEHHIYLTFLSALRSDQPFNRAKSTNTIIQTNIFPPFNEIVQTSESALKELLYNRQLENDAFTLDKMFFFETKELTDEIIDEDNPNTRITTKAIFESQMKNFINAFNTNLDWDASAQYIRCGNIEEITNLKKSILKMSRRIMKFYHDCLEQDETSTVTLHVDLTGGPRTAIMLMLAIIRLVAYQGIQIGSISYANLDNKKKNVNVYEGKDIYLLFDMIAGFSEFNRYGSVHTLQEYFDKVPTNDMLTNRLLETMGDFSEAISLSSRGLFQSAIEQLDTVLSSIQKSKSKDNKFEAGILKLMHGKIKDSYQTIIEDKDNDLVYIDWCLKNDYLQQALVLFTEYIPRTILKENILFLDTNKFNINKAEKRSIPIQCFNQINDKVSTYLLALQRENFNSIYSDITRALDAYINDLQTEANHIKKLTTKLNTPITKESTNLDIVDNNLIHQFEQIINNNKNLSIISTEGYNYKSIIKLLSNLALAGANIIELNTFPVAVRAELIRLMIDTNENIKNLLTIDRKYHISLTATNQYYSIRDALYTAIKDLLKRARKHITARDSLFLLFGLTINYHYNYEENFPTNVFNIEGLELNTSLTKELANDVIELLLIYNNLKKPRNDSSHANEKKQSDYVSSKEIAEKMNHGLSLIKKISEYIKHTSNK